VKILILLMTVLCGLTSLRAMAQPPCPKRFIQHFDPNEGTALEQAQAHSFIVLSTEALVRTCLPAANAQSIALYVIKTFNETTNPEVQYDILEMVQNQERAAYRTKYDSAILLGLKTILKNVPEDTPLAESDIGPGLKGYANWFATGRKLTAKLMLQLSPEKLKVLAGYAYEQWVIESNLRTLDEKMGRVKPRRPAQALPLRKARYQY
jgi:hypothetical protein